jgi:predicted O-methyltransferase YrrM
MNKITEEILQKRKVTDAEGKEYPLHSETSREQSQFLEKLITDIDASFCVEVGLAYGISSLFIAEAIAAKKGRRFLSIDPFQSDWQDIGLLNLKRAGFSPFVEFHREPSHAVLPRLLAAGERIDFAYVDTSKVFDVVMVDAYFLTRLLKVGGILAFDDCMHPGVRKLVRYMARWPHLKIAGKHNVYHSSLKRRMLSRLMCLVPVKRKIFSEQGLILDEDLGTNATCVAFKKIAEDERPWDWYCDF